ncbi:DOMON domain-containing protein [Loa loa]|uniref:DOMON domain-containing protein n=1 Tax=Loa loa TaxID=7209 RepID=A0A1I7VHW7_LOALO|nr:DOMON domain-containing protein [Loa loa]EJD75439.1 DOMON domain-containing protein [Loa loa]
MVPNFHSYLFPWFLAVLSGSAADSNLTINSYDPEYGVYIGELPDPSDADIKGRVYIVNETTLQVINFTYNGKAPDLYFWLDQSDAPSVDGLKIPSFEFGVAPIGLYKNAERVVLVLPGLHKISSFKSFSLFCLKFEHNFGTVSIPDTVVIPKPQFLATELRGSRYNVGSGPILIIDRRTIKIFGFTFDGDKAPDGYFFVGRGPNVAHDSGVKVSIRGRDTAGMITAMNERYRGGQDIIIDLPVEYDINHIDWLSVYCYKFRVDFGHVSIMNVSQRIPPYIPPQKRFDDIELSKIDGWALISLLGTDDRLNFTFQLGPPGGRRGYQFMAHARPAKYVWYVNGYLADIYLKRGVTYTFNVEGGNDKSTSDFYNPLYISDDPFGGYAKLSNDEREQVKIVAGHNPNETAGRLCLWSHDGGDDEDADKFNSFIEYRRSLKLKCIGTSKTATFHFTPTAETPDTLYYQSYSTYNMGWKIHVVDDLPKDIADFVEEPYQYDIWLQQHNLLNVREGSLSAAVSYSAIQVYVIPSIIRFMICSASALMLQ